MTRILISTRVFGLAAVLGLAAAASVVPEIGGTFLLLCAISAMAAVPQPTRVGRIAMAIVEGGLVALTLSVGGVIAQPLGLYLAVPALIVGLIGGVAVTLVTLLTELAMIAAVQVVSQQADLVPESLRDALPWLLTGLATGLLGAWVRHLKSHQPADAEQTEYAAAHRLLDELRLVSRRLSSGLDSVRLASAMLEASLVHVGGGRGAILVRSAGGEFTTLAVRSEGGSAEWDEELVSTCWLGAEPMYRREDNEAVVAGLPGSAAGQVPAGLTIASPVRVGNRMVAVLVVERIGVASDYVMQQIQALLDEGALPLSAALVFDEIRATATVEERQRLAREIHDGVAQEIASLGYLVDALEPSAGGSGDIHAHALLRRELGRVVDDLRLSIFDLRSQVTPTAGLGSVLADYLQEMGARSGTAIHLTLDESPARLGLGHEEQLLRIVQEAVTNARKHSRARNLWVSCWIRSPAAEILVEDDGAGLPTDLRAEGFGMSIMSERAQRIGASLTVGERPDGGTRVAVRLGPQYQLGSATRRSRDARHRPVAAGRAIEGTLVHA